MNDYKHPKQNLNILKPGFNDETPPSIPVEEMTPKDSPKDSPAIDEGLPKDQPKDSPVIDQGRNTHHKGKQVRVTNGSLNIRRLQSKESGVLVTLVKNDILIVLADDGDWLHVTFNEYTGYVIKAYTESV